MAEEVTPKVTWLPGRYRPSTLTSRLFPLLGLKEAKSQWMRHSMPWEERRHKWTNPMPSSR